MSQSDRRISRLGDLVDDRKQLLVLERLHDPACRARLPRLALHLFVGFRRKENDRHAFAGMVRAILPDELDSVHSRHVQVGDDCVDLVGDRFGEALFSIARLDHLIART